MSIIRGCLTFLLMLCVRCHRDAVARPELNAGRSSQKSEYTLNFIRLVIDFVKYLTETKMLGVHLFILTSIGENGIVSLLRTWANFDSPDEQNQASAKVQMSAVFKS